MLYSFNNILFYNIKLDIMSFMWFRIFASNNGLNVKNTISQGYTWYFKTVSVTYLTQIFVCNKTL